MPQQKVATEQFGVMTFNSLTDSYEAEVDMPHGKPQSLSIAIGAEDFDTGLKRMSAFLAWLKENYQSFQLALEYEIQNHDLVWDEVWDSILGKDWVDAEAGFLAEYLNYGSVDFRRGRIRVWIDTSGLHTDHMIRATLDEAMKIEDCELV
jgi:hypothetical protein